MPAPLTSAHPNYGKSSSISSTMHNLAVNDHANLFKRAYRQTLEPAMDDSMSKVGVARFIPPRDESFDTVSPSLMQQPTTTTIRDHNTTHDCDSARRHWNTCVKCRRRDFFMTMLEMVAYVLMGILIIIALKTNK